MKYYNKNNELIELNLELAKFHGGCSNIYQITQDIYFKKYFEYTQESARINLEIFQNLKKLNHPHTNEIIDLLYDFDETTNLNTFNKPLPKKVAGYLYIFLKEENIDILQAPTEYILYNITELEKLCYILTELKIKIRDLKRENTIFHEDKIILIDLDSLKLSKQSYTDLVAYNQKILYSYLISLFLESKSYSWKYKTKISSLFESGDQYDNIASTLQKKLKNYKNVMEYIQK